jgi:hypothetical protein
LIEVRRPSVTGFAVPIRFGSPAKGARFVALNWCRAVVSFAEIAANTVPAAVGGQA